ncbi:MAG: hypothetical protein HYX38_12055 [Rhodospirillales bacterium]|nr:hypothetical protein [Rhodospirillales bacterium]
MASTLSYERDMMGPPKGPIGCAIFSIQQTFNEELAKPFKRPARCEAKAACN